MSHEQPKSLARLGRVTIDRWAGLTKTKRAKIFAGLRKMKPNIVGDVQEHGIAISSDQWRALERGEAEIGIDETVFGRLLGFLAEMYWPELLAVTPR